MQSKKGKYKTAMAWCREKMTQKDSQRMKRKLCLQEEVVQQGKGNDSGIHPGGAGKDSGGQSP